MRPRRVTDFSGFLYLCMDGRRAISSLISSLLVPNDDIRVCDTSEACHIRDSRQLTLNQDALLNLLFTIFKIKLPAWKDAFLDGKRLTGRLVARNHVCLA